MTLSHFQALSFAHQTFESFLLARDELFSGSEMHADLSSPTALLVDVAGHETHGLSIVTHLSCSFLNTLKCSCLTNISSGIKKQRSFIIMT